MDAPKKIIDSHSSALNNKRLQFIMIRIDLLATGATNSKRFPETNAYFNECKQLYRNIKSVFNETERNKADKIINAWDETIEIMDRNPECRGKKALKHLLYLSEELNFIIIHGLHTFDYFFRTGSPNVKGLKNLNFFNQTIFTKGEENGIDPGSKTTGPDSS